MESDRRPLPGSRQGAAVTPDEYLKFLDEMLALFEDREIRTPINVSLALL